MKPIYLDYNATTPVNPSVLEEMLPYLRDNFGNPSSSHSFGIEGKKAVSLARARVAGLINCDPDEIVFTSGGSESNNYAIKGAAHLNQGKGKHLITTKVEHPAVREVFYFLKKEGFETDFIGVDEYGTADLKSFEKALKIGTILVSIMHSNNEVGTIQPIEEIAQILKDRGIIFHTDAAQSVGKVNIDVKKLGVNLLSIAGHKLYAPKGIGALYVKKGTRLAKLMHGANHERGMRAGTENVPYVVALGKACEIAKKELELASSQISDLRNALYKGLKKEIPEIKLNGHPENRLPNTLSVSFPGVNANTLLSELTEIAASPGAACHSDNIDEISYVLKAMGKSEEEGLGTVRFSTGRETTKEEIKVAVKKISEAYKRLNGRGERDHELGEEKDVKLTKYTQGLGCACKIRPKLLEEVLKGFKTGKDQNILVGIESSDDAAVYKIDSKTAIVQTVDFFTPIVDDPYDYGRIAAANSLSDIYAMGAKPLFALSVVGFPSKRLPMNVLDRILKGAREKALEAGIEIIGGHTVEDTEPKFGLSITGIIHPDKIITNGGVKPSDKLILTKPIGAGIVTTAIKRGLADEKTVKDITEMMAKLNKDASEAMIELGVNSCTDVTGFGLLGHAYEMAKAGDVGITIFHKDVPIIENAKSFVGMDIIPGGTMSNLDHFSKYVDFQEGVDEASKILLADAQTSGGLLISIDEDRASELVDSLNRKGIPAKIIGKVDSKGKGRIKVV